MTQTISVQVQESYDLSVVEALYDELENSGLEDSLFLSRQWIFSTLHAVSSQPLLLTFFDQTSPVGFAFVGKQSAWYGDSYFLNQCGTADDDQMWIEHNDIIAIKAYQSVCRAHLLDYLCRLPRFHRIVISLSCVKAFQSSQLFEWSVQTDNVAYVDMTAFASSERGFESTLSKNSKSALRRATKYIEQHYGTIEMKVHQNKLDQLLIQDVAPLHIAQWQNNDYGSGFNNPIFCDFHKRLSASSNHKLQVELISFHAGEQVLGYLYNMKVDKTVYFYLSAIAYVNEDNKFKPGMVMHKLAIEHYAKQGFRRYDFLAGHARYKESLSTGHYPMYTMHLAKDGLANRAMHKINRWLKGFKAPQEG